jgi:membrane protein implicated in regulation of membrane protease activity
MAEAISNITLFWLILGITFMLIEVSVIPGFGSLFLGLGAFTVTILLAFDVAPDDEYLHQFILLLMSTSSWLIILWRPLVNYLDSSASKVKDVDGSEATIYSKHLNNHGVGKIKWSGVIMNAKMDSSQDEAEKGELVLIDRVEGNIAICKKPEQ